MKKIWRKLVISMAIIFAFLFLAIVSVAYLLRVTLLQGILVFASLCTLALIIVAVLWIREARKDGS